MSDNFVNLFAEYKNKIIMIKMNDRKTIEGKLIEYDKIMNVTLDDAKDISNKKILYLGMTLVRGSRITAISFPTEK
jgi:small nuclear ribonucleoprotein (snRNP)-like protein